MIAVVQPTEGVAVAVDNTFKTINFVRKRALLVDEIRLSSPASPGACSCSDAFSPCSAGWRMVHVPELSPDGPRLLPKLALSQHRNRLQNLLVSTCGM